MHQKLILFTVKFSYCFSKRSINNVKLTKKKKGIVNLTMKYKSLHLQTTNSGILKMKVKRKLRR